MLGKMKRFLYAMLVLVVMGSKPVMAGDPASPAPYTFKTTEEDVVLEVERGKGEVVLHLLVKDLSQYDHILVERSAENQNYFGQCKYISCAEEKTVNDQLTKQDKYPFSAAKDVYYRIKTVTKDGVSRVYPAVLLAAVQ